jgi:uncharacterized phiE125 gp8 family phage protein
VVAPLDQPDFRQLIQGDEMRSFPRRASSPAEDPITLAEALVHLRVSPGVEDAYITSLIPVVREACENRIERTLVQTSWVLTLDSFPDAVELLMPPVLAVSSVQYTDDDGALQVLNPADYVVDRAREPGWLVPAPGRQWPATESGINKLVVTYTAGYGATAESVPAPLKHWMLLALTDLYENRAAHGEKPSVAHGFVDQLLQPYRLMGW